MQAGANFNDYGADGIYSNAATNANQIVYIVLFQSPCRSDYM